MPNTGPFSFIQYYQDTNEPIVKEILDQYIKAGSLFTKFPIATVPELKRKTRRVLGNLPVPTAMRIGQEPTVPFVQDVDEYEEPVYLVRDNFLMDSAWKKLRNWVESDPVDLQVRSYLQGKSFWLNNLFINNDPTSVNGVKDAFVGIKQRLAYPQKFGLVPGFSIPGTADLSDAGLSQSGAIKFSRDIETILAHMGADDGDGVVGIVSPQMMRSINALVKFAGTTGGFEITKDSFDRTVTKFKGMEIVSSGYQAPLANGQQTTPIIDSTQDINGWSPTDSLYNPTGGNYYTSMYIIKGGKDDFSTWQVADPSMVQERVSGSRQWIAMFDAWYGLYCPNPRAMARIYGYKINGPQFD